LRFLPRHTPHKITHNTNAALKPLPPQKTKRSGNLVEALDQLGDRAAAQSLLEAAVSELRAVAADKEAAEASGGAAKPDPDDELAVQTHVDAAKANQAMLRAAIDLARLHMKAQAFDASKAVLNDALEVAKAKAGDDSHEAASVLAALATAHRQAGELSEAAAIYERLYEMNAAASGTTNQSAVRFARFCLPFLVWLPVILFCAPFELPLGGPPDQTFNRTPKTTRETTKLTTLIYTGHARAHARRRAV
jgi:tetratricopeptide (TPR) repeat protein